MFKLEFPADNKPLALAIGKALTEYAGGAVEAAGTHIIGNRPAAHGSDTPPTVSDDMAALEEYNAAESVKLNDSAAGLSESQASTEDHTAAHQETAQQGAGDAPSVDKNGVPPNWSYCAKAAKPFYASGKYAGQWKKGTKVDQIAYDNWYTAALADTAAQNTAPAEDFDTSNAFGGGGEQAANTAAGPAAAPVGIGPFIMWTSEQQTAGHLTQVDITEAYKVLGLEQKDISPIEPNAQTNIASLHAVLSAKVPA